MDRRTFLATGATTASAGIAGCSVLNSGSKGGGDLMPAKSDWTVSESVRGEKAEAAVDSATQLRFAVTRCNQATAMANLGSISGTLHVTFDWRADPDQWWEIPVARLLEDGNEVKFSGNTVFEMEQGTVTEGTFDGTATVDGDCTIELGLEPSDSCANFDHAETRFSVRNLAIEMA